MQSKYNLVHIARWRRIGNPLAIPSKIHVNIYALGSVTRNDDRIQIEEIGLAPLNIAIDPNIALVYTQPIYRHISETRACAYLLTSEHWRKLGTYI